MNIPPTRDDGLQISEWRRFQEVFWSVERWAWAVFVFLLLLALLGLTGAGGYLAIATETLTNGDIKHPRISRWETSEEMQVAFNAGAQTHQLTLDNSLFRSFKIEGIQPQPENTQATPDGLQLEFSAETDAPMMANIYLRTLRPGLARYTVALDGEASRVITLILP